MPQIFLSYAWADNKPRFDGMAWVSKFSEMLTDRLREVSGTPIKVWMDQTERKGNELPQSIQNAIHESDFFIALCSPNFVTSKWCQKELQQFIQDKSQVLGLPEAEVVGKYVLKVIKLKNSQVKWPKTLDNLVEYQFYKQLKSYSWEELMPTELRYYELINELSWDLHSYFQDITPK